MGQQLESYRHEFFGLVDYVTGGETCRAKPSTLPDGYRWVPHQPPDNRLKRKGNPRGNR